MMIGRLRHFVIPVLCVSCVFLFGQESDEFPALTGLVVDQANLLTPPLRDDLIERVEQFNKTTGDHLVVVTVTTLHGYDIAEYGTRLGNYWGVGEEGKDNGILLIVAPNERKVRLAVGYGLEERLTPGICQAIIDNRILPNFRQSRFRDGIINGIIGVRGALTGNDTQSQSAEQMFLIFLIGAILIFFTGFMLIIQKAGRNYMAGGSGRYSNRSHSSTHRSWSGSSFGGSSFGGGSSGGSFGGGGASGSW